MKMKIFTLLSGLFACGMVLAQAPTGIVKQATIAPVIDGVVDTEWANANVYNIDKPFQSDAPTLGAPGETTWRALWTDDGTA